MASEQVPADIRAQGGVSRMSDPDNQSNDRSRYQDHDARGRGQPVYLDLLTTEEHPVRTATEMWVQLPPDPRKPQQHKPLRVVK